MTIEAWQAEVDHWIKSYGVRYFSELTNLGVLMEEVGEFARLMTRIHGEQSFKKPLDESEQQKALADELADIIFVITCLANQMDIDITAALDRNMSKKTSRDADRHKNNQKLTKE